MYMLSFYKIMFGYMYIYIYIYTLLSLSSTAKSKPQGGEGVPAQPRYTPHTPPRGLADVAIAIDNEQKTYMAYIYMYKASFPLLPVPKSTLLFFLL